MTYNHDGQIVVVQKPASDEELISKTRDFALANVGGRALASEESLVSFLLDVIELGDRLQSAGKNQKTS